MKEEESDLIRRVYCFRVQHRRCWQCGLNEAFVTGLMPSDDDELATDEDQLTFWTEK